MTQQNPLEDLIVSILNANGFENLDDDAKATYLPQFMAQAEQRIGAALMPLLTKESAAEFVELTKKETTPEQWWKFWETSVPNFTEVVKATMEKFAGEVKESLAL